jgi:hypothetical protein
MNLKSSVNSVGKTTTQIFHFVGNVKRTFHGLQTDTMQDGELFKVTLADGRLLLVNKANLLMTEVFEEVENIEMSKEDLEPVQEYESIENFKTAMRDLVGVGESEADELDCLILDYLVNSWRGGDNCDSWVKDDKLCRHFFKNTSQEIVDSLTRLSKKRDIRRSWLEGKSMYNKV